MGCFHAQQFAQGSHVRGYRVRAPGDRSWPMLTATIDPRDLHAGSQRAGAVKVGVAARAGQGEPAVLLKFESTLPEGDLQRSIVRVIPHQQIADL